LRFEYPRHVRFVCERCALCCGDSEERVRQILLLKVEAKRIAQKTKRKTEEFAEKIAGSEPYLFCMRKTMAGKCVFLSDNSCSIYDTRPLICRFYPFELKNTGNDTFSFTYTKECLGIGKGSQLKRSFFQKLFKESARMMTEDTQSDKEY
jgi:Fe-S-cluster containining protein